MTTAPRIEIISQGDELIEGRTLDTNSGEIARGFEASGYRVARMSTVGDEPNQLVDLFRVALERSDEIVCTGGLGPTEDDHTVDAVCRALDVSPSVSTVATAHVEAWLAARGRIMSAAESRQTRIPAGATTVANPTGSAMGFCIELGASRLWCLPGVPSEMRAMFAQTVLPAIRDRHTAPGFGHFKIGVFGLPEADIATRIADVDLEGRALSFTAGFEGNWLTIRKLSAEDDAGALRGELRERLGRHLFSETGQALHEVVAGLLSARGQTLSTAESCTGGLLAHRLTSVSGASAWMLEGTVAYANAAKMRICGVSTEQLKTHGAVSESVAKTMAQGVREHAGSDWGIGTTGIAGPTGGTPDKPVGTVHVAVAGRDRTVHRQLLLRGSRERVAVQAVAHALNELRCALLTD